MFTAALAVKAAVLFALHDHPLLQPRGSLDTAVYVELAKNGAPPVAFFVSPLYLYFIRIVFLAGGGALAAQLVQILLGAAAVVLIADVAGRLFGRRAFSIAAGLLTLTGVVTFYEVTILQSALDPFLTASTLWLLERARGEHRAAAFLPTGIAAGVLTLNRPNALIWAAGFALFLAVRHRQLVVPFAIGFVVAIAPVTARNWLVSGEPVMISSHGGLNLYIGNHEQADGTYRRVAGIRPDIRGQQIDAQRMAEQAEGRSLTAREASRWFVGRSLEWMRTRPLDAAGLFLRKLAYTVNHADLALNYSYAFFSRDVRSPLMLLVVGPWLLFPLAALAVHRDRTFFLPLYTVSVAIFFVSSRYRLPLLVASAAFAAGGVVALLERRHLLRDVATVAAVALVVMWDFGLSDGRAEEAAGLVFYEIERGRMENARALLERIDDEHPDPAMLYFRTGLAYRDAGRRADAIAMFQRARTAPATAAETHLAAGVLLAEAYLAENRTTDALAIARAVEPSRFDAAHAARLGHIAVQARDAATARAFLEHAVSLAPRSASAHHELGLAYIMSGDAAAARRSLDTARQLDPANATTLLNLAVLEAQAGELDLARTHAREALRLRPGYEQAAGLLDALR